MKFQYGDIVQHKKTKIIGVVAPQMAMMQEDGPFAFIAEGGNTGDYIGENDPNFKIIGHYKAYPTMEGCGAGKGREACVFGGIGAEGLVCLRFGIHHWNLAFFKKEMGAKRRPGALFPDCFTDKSDYTDK